jgi:hypothetical protein
MYQDDPIRLIHSDYSVGSLVLVSQLLGRSGTNGNPA